MHGTGTKALLIVYTLAALGLVTSYSCGVKRSPRPLSQLRPRPPTQLRGELQADGVIIWCRPPQRYEDGTAIDALQAIEFLRARVPEKRSCPSCPLRYTSVGEVSLKGSPKAERKVTFKDMGLLKGLYRYRAVARDLRGVSSRPSKVLEVYWAVPPEGVHGLKARIQDGAVWLSWEPVRKRMDGAPIGEVTYEVYKTKRGMAFPPRPENKDPIRMTKFVDRAIRKGLVYLYRVRAVRMVEGHKVYGRFSDEVEVSTLDIVAPQPPKGVVAFPIAEGVRVVWEASESQDVVGYRVYRSKGPSGPWRLVSPPLVPTVVYDDLKVEPGGKYWYCVTALDEAVPPNESPLSGPARVVVPMKR